MLIIGDLALLGEFFYSREGAQWAVRKVEAWPVLSQRLPF